MLVMDLVVSVITIAVVSAGAIMALLVNYFKSPYEFMNIGNQTFLPVDKDALKLVFTARPERIEFMGLGRDRVSIEEFEFVHSVVDQPYDDFPQNLEFICIAFQLQYNYPYDDFIVSPLSCSGHGLRRPFVRCSSERFWKGGRSIDIIGFRVRKLADERAYVGWVLKEAPNKLSRGVFRAHNVPVMYEPIGGANSYKLHYALQWGEEVMLGQDILADEGIFLTVWYQSQKEACGDLALCNQFSVGSELSPEIVDTWDVNVGCCMEAAEYRAHRPFVVENPHPHGKSTGVPLLDPGYGGIENGTRKPAHIYMIRSIMDELRFTKAEEGIIEYYRVFTMLIETEHKLSGQASSHIDLDLFRKTSAKKFFLTWFRYSGKNRGTQQPRNNTR